jgi:hypothetical protein
VDAVHSIREARGTLAKAPGRYGFAGAEVRPSPVRLRVAALAGVACCLAGAGAAAAAHRAGGTPLAYLPGLALLLAGGALLLGLRRLAGLRFWVSPEGLLLVTGGKRGGSQWYLIERPQGETREGLSPAVAAAARAARPAGSPGFAYFAAALGLARPFPRPR